MGIIAPFSAKKPQQLSLPLAIEDVPRIVREHGLCETHRYPYVSKGKPRWEIRRVPTARAWEHYPELQLHSATARTALVLDCDTSPLVYLEAAMGSCLPAPNWIVSSPSTSHAHIVYCLARPVLSTKEARIKPVKMLARVAEFYTEAYQADTGYISLLTHNPTHRLYADSVTWLREEPWLLSELAELIPRGWRIPKKPATVEGRNCALFLAAMTYFGQRDNQDMSTDLDTVHAWLQTAFDEWYGDLPLNQWHRNECWWIARSVTRYCRENLASPRCTPKFRGRQAWKGRRSGEKRRKGSIEEKQPWLDLGVSRATYFRHQGAPAPTLTDLAPWELMGISRSTWYRHYR